MKPSFETWRQAERAAKSLREHLSVPVGVAYSEPPRLHVHVPSVFHPIPAEWEGYRIQRVFKGNYMATATADERVVVVTPLGMGTPGTPNFRPSGVEAEIRIPDSLTILGDRQEVPKGRCVMRIMTKRDGDKRVVWNPDDLCEIADAERMFMELVEQGLVPYKVGTNGKATSEVMDRFDPYAGEVIFLPVAAVCGG